MVRTARIIASIGGALSGGLLIGAIALALGGGATFQDLLWSWSIAEWTVSASFAGVGSVLASRRVRNPVGWLCLVTGLALAAQTSATRLDQWNSWGMADAASGVLYAMAAPAIGLLAVLLLVFPHGRVPSRGWQPVLWAVAGAIGVGTMASWGLLPIAVWEWAEPVWLLGVAAGAAALIQRFRRSRGIERQQLKVVAFTVAVATVAFFGGVLFSVAPITSAAFLPLIPIAIGVAVLRYGLYSIDRLIRRTASYAVITALLAVVYVVAVYGAQIILAPVTPDSQLAVAASTLVVAALFRPVRSRVNHMTDRRFNRARYDAQRITETFGARLRYSVELEDLQVDLLQNVRTTVEPASASLWLRAAVPASRSDG